MENIKGLIMKFITKQPKKKDWKIILNNSNTEVFYKNVKIGNITSLSISQKGSSNFTEIELKIVSDSIHVEKK